MSRFISFIVPYLVGIIALLMSFVSFEYQDVVLPMVIGVLIGFWFVNVRKTEGTKSTLTILTITFALLVIASVISFMYSNTSLSILSMMSILQLFAIYIITKNKPTLTMSYKYSFKNKRRRYF